MKKFYVYVYLDPRKPGHYVYGEYEFDYEPFYVGKGSNGRSHLHLNGNKNNTYFDRKIKKIQKIYGYDPIIVKYQEMLLETVSFILEQNMIKTIGRLDLKTGPLCNHTNGGEGMSGHITSNETRQKLREIKKGQKHTEETKEKISKSKKGHNYCLGKIRPEEVKKKISNTLKGRKLNEDTKQKISISLKGRLVSKETRDKISKSRKSMSEEVKKKISIKNSSVHKGKIISEETRRKMVDSQQKRRQKEHLLKI